MSRRSWALWLAVLVLLVGIGLRLILYNAQGIDGDDSFSLSLSSRDGVTLINGLLAAQLDVHPPLHFLLLKGWVILAGDSLLSLRTMNILLDALDGAFIVALASRAFGRRSGWRVGLAAGALWAVSASLMFSIFQVRMYTLTAMLLAGGALCMVTAIHWRRWHSFALAAAYGLFAAYSHLVGLIGFAILGGITVLFARSWRDRLWAVLCFGAAAVLSLPVVHEMLLLRNSPGALAPQIAGLNFPNVLLAGQAVIVGMLLPRLPGSLPGILAAGVFIVALVGAVVLAWRWASLRLGGSLIAFTVLLCAAMTYLAQYQGIYKLHYLAPYVPLLLALLAAGVVALPRLIRPLATTGLIIAFISAAAAGATPTARDDFAAAVAYVQQHELPGDQVLVIPDYAADAFRYHFTGKSPVLGEFPRVTAGVDYANILQFVTKPYRRVWLVSYETDATDPDKLAEKWFDAHAIAVTAVYPTHMQVKGYDFQPIESALPSYATPENITVAPGVVLAGVYQADHAGAATDQRLHPPSNWAQITLYWGTAPSANPQVLMVNAMGEVYGGSLDEPNGLLAHNLQWPTGSFARQTIDINMNPVTPPGNYRIVIVTAAGQVPIGAYTVQ